MPKTVVLPNRARMILLPMQDTKATTLLILFGVGSRYESKEINGVSHFIEHLMFKGTKKRPTSLSLSKELDRVGAEFNAMTSKDYTGYIIKINHEKQDLAVEILSDMLLNSTFDSKEITKEKGVIVEEINMYHDNPIMQIENLLESSVFQGNTLAWDIAGPASVIKKMTRKQIVDYKNKYYQADNVVIAVAGKINKQVESLLKNKFVNKLGQTKTIDLLAKPFQTKQTKPRVKVEYRDTKQVQLAIGFPSYGYNSSQTYAEHLLSIVMGGNMSSRLFTSVREKKGLCYFVRCYPNYYKECGNFYIQVGLDLVRIQEAVKLIFQELKKVKDYGITTKELKDAKEFLRGKIVLNLEDSANLAEYYAKQELLVGKSMSPEEKFKKYQQVTLKDIKFVANEVFEKNKINLALIGPFKSDERFRKMVSEIRI